MARSICPEPGCPAFTPGGRCPAHARPNSTVRGYDAQHQRESREWKQRIRAGQYVECWDCHQPITDPDDCDLGHVGDERDTAERRAERSPEHARGCNRSAAGKASRALA